MSVQERNVYVIEVTPAIDDAGTLKTFLFSSEGWPTLPTDTPAEETVQARLDQPGNFRRELFSGNRTIGAVRPAFGECTLINNDGGLDDFARYGFDGREFKLSYGPSGAPYPSGFTTLLKATLRGATFDTARVRLVIRDRMELLDRPLSQTTFAGTGNEEGGAELVGKRKPLSFGQVRSIHPQLVNNSNLLYSVGAPPAGQWAWITYVRDGQNSGYSYAMGQIPPLAGYADTVADLLSATIDPGYYWMCPSAGLFRVGTKPAVDITASVSVQPVGGGLLAEAGTILQQMATAAGIPDIDSADVAAINASKQNIYGYHVDGDETALSAMGKVASGAFCWFGMGADDVLHMGALDIPSGTPVIELRSHDITKIERLDGGDANRLIPIWKATAKCSHNDAPQSSFISAVDEWVRTWSMTEWPGEVVSSNASVKTKHLYAEEMTVEVYGGTQTGIPHTDGGAAAKAMELYGVDRELVQVTMKIRADKFSSFEIGSVISLRLPRYGWSSGKLFRVVAIDANFGSNKLTVTIWG